MRIRNCPQHHAVILAMLLGLDVTQTVTAFYHSAQPSVWGVRLSSFVFQSDSHSTTTLITDQRKYALTSATTSSSNSVVRRLSSRSRSARPISRLFENGQLSPKESVRLIIAGAPASGKGTQCEMIKERYGVVHLSTGDMLRAAVSAQTDVGKLAQSFMDSGKLVPDQVIIGVVKDRLMQEDCQKRGWLLDGFPRTQAQAQALEDEGIAADCFIFLNVPDEVLVERVVGRRTDPVTGKIYHLKFNPPPADDKTILSRLEHRSDDTEEKIIVRLQQFHANVEAVRDSYIGISVTIDGNQAKDVVSDKIFAAVDEKLAAEVAA